MTKETTTDTPNLAAWVFMGASLVPATIVGGLAASLGAGVTMYIVALLTLIVLHLGLVHWNRRGLVYLLHSTSATGEAASSVRILKGALLPKRI